MNLRFLVTTLLALCVVVLVGAVLVGFNVQPRPALQLDRIGLVQVATRIAVLEEANVDLEERVSELERAVESLRASDASEADAALPVPAPRRDESIPLPTTAPSAAATDEVTEEVTEEATAAPTAEITAETEALPTEVPAATPAPIDLDEIEIDWGPLTNYFEISNVRLEMQQVRNAAGHLLDVEVLAFDVQAEVDFMLGIFQATFYDEEGVEVSFISLVEFDPDYLSGWQPGQRSRARIVVPAEMDQVATIRFGQVF